MHTHSEHRWTVHPVTHDGRALPGWESRRGATRPTQLVKWVEQGYRLGVLLRGLTAIRLLTDESKALADRFLPRTPAAWGNVRLYAGRTHRVGVSGGVEVLSEGAQVVLPEDPVGRPARCSDLASRCIELGLASLVVSHPDHAGLIRACIDTSISSSRVYGPAGMEEVQSGSKTDDPWSELRMHLGSAAEHIRSLAISVPGHTTFVSPKERFALAWAAVTKAMSMPDLATAEIRHDIESKAMHALRDSFCEVGGYAKGSKLTSQSVVAVLRKLGAETSRRYEGRYRWHFPNGVN